MKTAPCLIFRKNNLVWGYAYASPYKEKSGYDWARELTIYIRPEKRGMGIGFQLYERLIHILKKQGYMKLLAAISSPNPASERFHSAHGFSKIAVFKNVAYKFDRAQDVTWWSLDIEQAQPYHVINYDYHFIWEQSGY